MSDSTTDGSGHEDHEAHKDHEEKPLFVFVIFVFFVNFVPKPWAVSAKSAAHAIDTYDAAAFDVDHNIGELVDLFAIV